MPDTELGNVRVVADSHGGDYDNGLYQSRDAVLLVTDDLAALHTTLGRLVDAGLDFTVLTHDRTEVAVGRARDGFWLHLLRAVITFRRGATYHADETWSRYDVESLTGALRARYQWPWRDEDLERRWIDFITGETTRQVIVFDPVWGRCGQLRSALTAAGVI